MKEENQVRDLLTQKFNKRRIGSLLGHFLGAMQKLEEGDWENSLMKVGKFVEAVVKLLWTYSGNSLPKAKKFSAGVYAQKIMGQVNASTIPSDGVRLQVPRACIFLYDITSNRGGRHDSDEFDPNEMDAMTTLPLCAWILAELVRFSSASSVSPDEARKIVDSIIERHFPFFEEIDGRIYINHAKHSSAPQCALLILFKKYPRRMSKRGLLDAVTRHGYKKSALKFGRLSPFVDTDEDENISIRAEGRRQVDEILQKKR